jgi:hypothetical protein
LKHEGRRRFKLSAPVVVVAAAVATIAIITDLSAGTRRVPVPAGINIGAGSPPVQAKAHLTKTAHLAQSADPPVTTTVAYSRPSAPATFIQSSLPAVTLQVESSTSSEPTTTTPRDETVPPTTTTTTVQSPLPSVTTTTDDGRGTYTGPTTTVGPVVTNPSTPSTTDK